MNDGFFGMGSEEPMSPGDVGADAPIAGITTKRSPWSVEETVSRLSAIARARELEVFALIDHSAEAADAGLHLRDTKVVIFGSPRAGTPVMDAVPEAALDLPLKVLVWADGPQTKLSYTSPDALAKRYGLNPELSARLAGIDTITDVVIDR
jgi:uncharacterized protein (DUF302 family)